ncbi:hypothetical protein ACEQ8H_000006 [Pleosporales sp. CAS-2024a]
MSFQAKVEVLGTCQATAPGLGRRPPSAISDAQDGPGILCHIRSLFAAPPSTTNEAQPRGRKRRKLGHSASPRPTADAEHVAIELAKVSMNLTIPPQDQGQEPVDSIQTPDYSTDALPLSLQSYQRTSSTGFRITVYKLGTRSGITITATAPSHFLDSISRHLIAARMIAQSQNQKLDRAVNRAASVDCRILPSYSGGQDFELQIVVGWRLNISVVEDPLVELKHMKEDLKLLSQYFPRTTAADSITWTLADFYDSVHVPPTDLQVSPRIRHALPDTLLYPFQTRAVDWLLRREGVAFTPSGALEAYIDDTPPASFRQAEDATGKVCYVSQLRGMVVEDLSKAQHDTLQSLRGGILAEEMGLGKTVELMALMTHHKRPAISGKILDEYIGAHVTPSGATLIITPPSILEQWINEIHNHAPELKALHYKGLPPSSAPKEEHAAATVENLLKYDVVLTTYNVLSKEIHHATPPPDRSLRNAKRHERRVSPLIEISWWRVCLDEAQMIESGVSQAAKVARIIPRCNAWAVSGTPLRKDVQDLRGLLIFLRCDAFANNKGVWDRLDKDSFQSIFNQIALRHTKDSIREELRLPPQKRIVITVPFTTIEEQNYSDMIRQMCDSCWLSPEGHPLDDGRDASHPEVIERMREWLVRLRQTCLHAHVGRKNRKALGAKNGALRTVHEVLEVMIEQNDTKFKAESRDMILQEIKLGHITAYAGNFEDRAQKALPYYREAFREARVYVQMCRDELAAEKNRLESANSGHVPQLEDEDSDGEDEKDGEHLGRLPVLRKALRSILEVEHACNFFIATTYHQIKESASVTQPEEARRLEFLETEWYEKAKLIRRELLLESKRQAQRQMAKVESRKPFHQIPKIDDLPDLGGIESRQVLNTMDNISDFLNAQAEQIHIWRRKMVDILLMRLIDDEDDQETTGEEYDVSLKAQDELYVYMMALRTLIADRHTATHGLRDTLVEHELRAAEKQALRKGLDDESENRGHAPELVIEVAQTRRKLQATLEGGSLKGVVSGIRSLVTALQWRADGGDTRAAAELTVVSKHMARVQAIASQQAKTIAELEKELDTFRATMNQRLEYYRQFQHISDTVGKYKEELDETFDDREFLNTARLHQQKKDIVARLKTRHTYLTHLRVENQADAQADCIICQDAIEIGVLTACGHKYCKECINTWWHAHRTCPMCKQKLNSSDFRDISFKAIEIKAQEEGQESASPGQSASPGSSNTSIYSDMSESMMKEIKMIDLEGSYGTKIDMMTRHLLWIRANDPGAKSIIFSQFGDFLEVLGEAFRKWRIGASSITDKDGIQKFKLDAAMECFLLDAKSDSSGLNLVNATYVFLCEPLINPAIELQAIARVHRIGQQRPTTVFMYLIADTVEEAIYDISVTRRLAHMPKAGGASSSSGSATPVVGETWLDKANSAEMQAAPLKALLRKKGHGEEVKADDLWRCLFGRPRKVAKW